MMSARTIVALVAFLAVSSRLLASAAFVASDSFDGTLTNGYFGYGIDVDGDFAIAGSPAASTSDFASIFERVNGEWQLVKNLTSPNPQSNGFFGHSVTISRTGFAAVGAYGETVQQPRDGRVYNYKRQANGDWTLTQSLTSSTGGAAAEFGVHVRMNSAADVMVVGDWLHDSFANPDGGAVSIYTRDEGADTWSHRGKEGAPGLTSGDRLGRIVGVAGDWAFGSSHLHDTSDEGVVFVYEKVVGQFVEFEHHQTLTSGDPETDGFFGYDMSGNVASDGTVRVIVGAYGETGSTGNGAAYIFALNTTSGLFEQEAKLLQTDLPKATGEFGRAVDISDDVAVVGAAREGSDAGAFYVFRRNSSTGAWEFDERITQGVTGTQFGRGLAISNGNLIVGATATSSVGAVHFYRDDTFLIEYDSNPLRCGDYDSTNQRYFYDDGTGCETTPTVSDACYYAAGALVTTDPATLRLEAGGAPHSRLEADDGTDYIYLAFDLADKYYNVRLVFADAGQGQCAHSDWEQVSATRDVTSLDACETTFVYRLPWSDAYNAAGSKCGWERDESGANVKLVLDFAVQADEDLRTMRNGTTITRRASFSLPVQVEFPTQVTASPVNVTVFAPVRALAVITGQSVTIDEVAVEATLTLELFTEVQKPFELYAITESTDVLPTGVTLETAMTGVEDEAVRQDSECDDTNADCANTWRWQYSTPSVAGGSNPCDFDGTYQVTFGVRCSEVSNTNCPIDGSTDSVEITLTVSTSNHCPTVIDSVDLSAALAVYDLPARADAQDDFVGDGVGEDGQTADLSDWQVAYFAAPVTSTQVAIDRTEFNQVWIVRHQETVSVADDDVVVLLDADNTIDESPYDSVGEIDCAVVAGVGGADATATAVSTATGCSPAKDGVGGTYSFNFKHGEGGNAVAGGYSTPIFEFDIRTDAAGFGMVDDAIETMQVNAVIDVEYANSAKRAGGAVQNNAQQSTVTSSFSMRTTSGTSSSGSTALFGVNAMVVYGAGAVLVVVVLAALVVVSRKRSNPGKMERVESTAELVTSV